jgi:hypothetical protein
VDLDDRVPDNGWRMRIGLYSYIAPAEQPHAPVRTRSARQPRAAKKAGGKGVNQ